MSGKSLTKTGERKRARVFTNPPRSPIFMIPNHKDSTPVSPREISNAAFDDSKVLFIIAGNTSRSPRKRSRTRATTKAMAKNAIQI